MLGDVFREIAVLVIVFAPLDRWVEYRSYTWFDFWATFGVSVSLFLMGVLFEKIRTA